MKLEDALGIVRLLIYQGISRENAINNPAVSEEFRARILEELEREELIILEPPRPIVAEPGRDKWLYGVDREKWYYWPQLRTYLLGYKRRILAEVGLLDEVTDRILGQLAPPSTDRFDIRGLVLGYVQSGKTENYTALIAKAADTGYRLIIILSGIDNGLRLQTQVRLKRELIGYSDGRKDAVPLPPIGRQWHEFTRDVISGDFQPGFANPASLQGSQPVLLVIKKNSSVLRRLLRWLDSAPEEIKQNIPLLVIDDEADLASVDTRGSHQREDEPIGPDFEDPSVINSRIRELLTKFQKSAYVAYTATPFANILIPHDTFNSRFKNDLYPKDFIIDLPKRPGYFGAEELFGISDTHREDESEGFDIIEEVPTEDVDLLESGAMPESLENALLDFVLASAAYSHRIGIEKPVTMLIHVSRLIADQNHLADLVDQRFREKRDEWRYQRQRRIRARLEQRWDQEFRPLIQSISQDRDLTFDTIEPIINQVFEAIRVRVINSNTGEVLDYDNEPQLKAIAIGGDRLSRGLTLEGLLVSYFIRRSPMYDTLMQMGRWFGYRSGYEDLTRIYTTEELADWYTNLAYVEHQMRLDLQVYEDRGMTPYQVGMRIWQHPSMQVTSPLKRRFARQDTISQSYSGQRAQTFRFPLNDLKVLADQEKNNFHSLKKLISKLGNPDWDDSGPIWSDVPVDRVTEFLDTFQAIESGLFSIDLVRKYIEHQVMQRELLIWTVAIRGRTTPHRKLGEIDLGLTRPIWQISRTRKKHTESLGVITSPGDEILGLSEDEKESMHQIEEKQKKGISEDVAARQVRSPEKGLVLIYPISKQSGNERTLNPEGNRMPLYSNPNDPKARDLVGLAISFPNSLNPQPVEAYLVGTVGWKALDDTDLGTNME